MPFRVKQWKCLHCQEYILGLKWLHTTLHTYCKSTGSWDKVYSWYTNGRHVTDSWLECGQYTFFINNLVKCIKCWLKLLHMPYNRLHFKTKVLFNHNSVGKQNWASNVRLILFSSGLAHSWDYQFAGCK